MEVHKGIYWYSSDQRMSVNLTPVPVARVREIQQLNRKGVKPDKLIVIPENQPLNVGSDLLLQNSGLSRFESKSAPRENRGKRRPQRRRNENSK
jgi:hypothetical protein